MHTCGRVCGCDDASLSGKFGELRRLFWHELVTRFSLLRECSPRGNQASTAYPTDNPAANEDATGVAAAARVTASSSFGGRSSSCVIFAGPSVYKIAAWHRAFAIATVAEQMRASQDRVAPVARADIASLARCLIKANGV